MEKWEGKIAVVTGASGEARVIRNWRKSGNLILQNCLWRLTTWRLVLHFDIENFYASKFDLNDEIFSKNNFSFEIQCFEISHKFYEFSQILCENKYTRP